MKLLAIAASFQTDSFMFPSILISPGFSFGMFSSGVTFGLNSVAETDEESPVETGEFCFARDWLIQNSWLG